MSSLAEFALALHAALTVDELLAATNRVLGETVRDAELALLRYDPRKELITQRATLRNNRVQWDSVAVSLDHLPRQTRTHLELGRKLTDLGAASPDYLKLLGWVPDATPARMWVRSIRLDGELAAVLAVHEPRRLFPGASVDDFEGASALFELAFARVIVADARTEAVRTLEKLTRSIHQKYEQLVQGLQTEVETLRDAMAAQQVVPASQAAELEERVRRLMREAADSARRLNAVEQQVSDAVVRLQSAHVELHEQSALVHSLREGIHAAREALQDAAAGRNQSDAILRALTSLDRGA